VTSYRYLVKDPDKAYISNNLWLPKKSINQSVVKAALTFSLNDEEVVVDELTGEAIGTKTKTLRLWDETERHIITPKEFISPSNYPNFPCEFEQIPPPDFEQVRIDDRIELRNEEQQRAYEALLQDGNGTLHVSCGKGKTVIALKVAATLKVPTIVIVNSTALLEQWKEEITKHLGVQSIGVLQGQLQDWKGRPIVLSMVHTLSNRRKMWSSDFKRYFGLAIYDECFTSDTLIDDTPIQKIRVGDTVSSYSEADESLCRKKVLRVFKKKPFKLIRIQAEGKNVICTPNHPFLTEKGWANAENLTCGSVVLCAIKHRSFIGKEGRRDPSKSHSLCLQRVRNSNSKNGKSWVRASEKGRSVLLPTMRSTSPTSGEIKEDVRNKSKIRLRENEKEQPDEKKRSARENEIYTKGDGVEAPCSRRERKNSPGGSTAFSLRPGLAHGSSYWDSKREGKAQRECIQTRYREQGVEAGNRSRRVFPLLPYEKKARQEERENLSWVRVDSIEILEPGSDGTFGGLCPDGFVYNLEVEDTHTYLANGFVVHNCHHMSAPVFVLSADMFYGKRISLTATASRTDGLETVYQYHLGRVIHKNLSQDLIPHTVFHVLHWKMPPEHKKLVIDRNKEVSTPRVRTYLGKLEWRNNLIYEYLAQDLKNGRSILVLSHSVDHVEVLHNYLSAAGAGMIVGKTPQESRMAILRNGNPVFGTFQLAREGLNKPSLDTLYVVTPFNNSNDLQQAWGRIQRRHEGKKEPLIRVFEDRAFQCCFRSCRGLRNVLKKFGYPYTKEEWVKYE